METRFHFHGRSCPPPRGRRVRWEETKDFEIFSSSRLVVFRNEIIKRASEPRFHEGRNWTEEGNTIIFTRLIIRFHVPTSIERQAGTHACTHAGLFIQLRARAFDSRPSPPTTDCPDFEPNTKEISTRRRIGRVDSVARASVRNGDACAKD